MLLDKDKVKRTTTVSVVNLEDTWKEESEV